MRNFFRMCFFCWTGLLLCPTAGQAADVQKIVILETMAVPVVVDFSRDFIKALDELGCVEGVTCQVERLLAEGNRDRADCLLADSLHRSRPDLVVAVATLATQVAHARLLGTGIPLLFSVVADPVGAGVINAIGPPTGTNVTGILAVLPRRIQLDYATRLAGQIKKPVRIGVVISDYPSSLSDLQMIKEAAAALPNVVIREYVFPYREMPVGLPAMFTDVVSGLASLEDEVDFWWEVSGPLSEVPEYLKLIYKHSDKPVLYGHRMQSVQAGALFGMIQNVRLSAGEAAKLARDILQGTDPGSIPVRSPAVYDLGINLHTAIELGIVIPSDMLELAGEHIYR